MEIGSGTARLTYDGHRADVLLNRPDKRNAMDMALIDDLTEAFRAVADADRDVRAMTLLGEGPVLSAGMDLDLMYEADLEGHEEIYEGLRGLFDALEAVPVPTVVGIKKAAIAGAFELTLPADFRVIGADAEYGLREVKLGIPPFGGATQRLPRLVGLAKAKELVLQSDSIDPEEAERIGLVNEVVDPGEVDARTREFADDLATRSPLGVEQAKALLDTAFDVPLEEGLDLEYERSAEVWDTEDRREGFAAAMERRDPEFEGR